MSEEVSEWLRELSAGTPDAVDKLVPRLYDELKQMASNRLRRERAGHTLRTTALVNEAYLKLQRQNIIRADDRRQFLAVAGNVMRQVLVDYARSRNRLKRGGRQAPLPLDEENDVGIDVSHLESLLDLDDALTRLAEVNPTGAQVVQLRFFSGLTLEETAEHLGASTKTIQRKWWAARAWLRREIALEREQL